MAARKLLGWKIWYAPTVSWSSEDGPWAEAPDGVQVLMLFWNDVREMVVGLDEYRIPRSRTVRLGKAVPLARFTATQKAAFDDEWSPE